MWIDVDGDNTASYDDQLGYAINDYNNLDGFLYGCGVRATERDENDVPKLCLLSERAVDTLKKTYDVYFNTVGGFGYGGAYTDDVLYREKFSRRDVHVPVRFLLLCRKPAGYGRCIRYRALPEV